LVVSGTPTLRHPGGEDQLEPWDLVFFPSGPAGAHLVRNNSDSTARVAMFSSKTAVDVVVYPDSDISWAIRSGFQRLETSNEVRNAPIRRLNAQLGYRTAPGRVLLRGPLATA
jgi:uncharacterized cupin superfamily protein